ncbi:MAG: cytochrome P450 [Bacteroidota bacterium]
MTRINRKSSSSILGETKYYIKDPLGFLQTNQRELGDAFGFRLAHRTIYFINKAEYVTHILQTNHKNYKKSLAYRKLSLMLGNGLFTSEGDFWLRQRRLAQPAFHKQRIDGYFEIIKKHTADFVKEVNDKDQFMLGSALTSVTLKIISETLLGLDLRDGHQLIEEKLPVIMKFMIRRITSGLNAPLWLPTTSNREFIKSSKRIRKMIEQMIARKRQQPDSNDLLTELINARDAETGEYMDDTQLTDEVLTFFLAGHETTAVSAFWAIWLLENNPAEKRKLLDELTSVNLEELQLSDLSALPYLDAVIKESMRLYSPVWVLGREAIDNDQIAEFKIEKGDSIIFSPYMIHRHLDYWDHPERYMPERFLTETAMPKNTYFPFGSGPRLCIGNNFAILELKVILIGVLKGLSHQFIDMDFPGFDCSLTLRPAKDKAMKPATATL